MENILSSNLAVGMRGQGLSNEEILDEMLEFAEMMENLTLVAQIKTRELQEMESIQSDIRQWSK